MEAQSLALYIILQGQLPWDGFHKEAVAQSTNYDQTKDDLVSLRLDAMFITENRGCKLKLRRDGERLFQTSSESDYQP